MISKRILTKIFWLFGSLLTLTIMASVLWTQSLYKEIKQRLEKGWFMAPIELYSAPDVFTVNKKVSANEMESSLRLRGYLLASSNFLKNKDYKWWNADNCQMNLGERLPVGTQRCLVFRQSNSRIHSLAFSKDNLILQVYSGEPLLSVEKIELEPFLFAQYYREQPILRQVLKLGDVPLYCSQAVTAIEDKNFLEHKGFSPLGFLRAVIKNLLSGYYAQGGSTITQQLVKNYFLTSDKTIRRKVKEIFMALILESQVNKEQILENYLNVIYMGQNGHFEVRGLGAASHHYLNKPLTELSLSECALLAALLNNPGRYNPYKNPEKSLSRRNKVLSLMREQNMIDYQQLEEATKSTLPKTSERVALTPAPYYVDAVFRQLKELNFLAKYGEAGLRIFTFLKLESQKQAQKTVEEQIANLETKNKNILSLKKEGKELQGLLIHVDVKTGSVAALTGGKSYQLSQYNRALDSRRQVGSIFKPLVFLAAMESQQPDGNHYLPTTLIADEPFVYKYEGQVWRPQNYTQKYHGKIPLYYALKNSINVATARLGIAVGLEHIIDVAKRMGVESELKPLPALTLGAFEMKPLEAAKVFTGIARFGSATALHFVESVERVSGEKIYQVTFDSTQQVAPEKVGQLVSMLKQTFISGTARSAKNYGFYNHAAGKTGTTSDTRDAWFAGFTPEDMILTWVGYDDNTASGLTGASGALPLWLEYIKTFTHSSYNPDFMWPTGLKKEVLLQPEISLSKDSEEESRPVELMVEEL